MAILWPSIFNLYRLLLNSFWRVHVLRCSCVQVWHLQLSTKPAVKLLRWFMFFMKGRQLHLICKYRTLTVGTLCDHPLHATHREGRFTVMLVLPSLSVAMERVPQRSEGRESLYLGFNFKYFTCLQILSLYSLFFSLLLY